MKIHGIDGADAQTVDALQTRRRRSKSLTSGNDSAAADTRSIVTIPRGTICAANQKERDKTRDRPTTSTAPRQLPVASSPRGDCPRLRRLAQGKLANPASCNTIRHTPLLLQQGKSRYILHTFYRVVLLSSDESTRHKKKYRKRAVCSDTSPSLTHTETLHKRSIRIKIKIKTQNSLHSPPPHKNRVPCDLLSIAKLSQTQKQNIVTTRKFTQQQQ